MAGAPGDVGRHGLRDVAMLECQDVGSGVGVDRPMAPRLGGEGDHQLNGIALVLGSRPRSRTDPNAVGTAGPRQTRRHHRRPQWQIQLADRSAAGGHS